MVCHYIIVHYSQQAARLHLRKPTPPGTKSKVFHLSAGLKHFDTRGEEAVSKELNQFNMLHTFTPLDTTTLTIAQWKNALGSLIFLTEKRNGDIKARACMNGKPQREHITSLKLKLPCPR